MTSSRSVTCSCTSCAARCPGRRAPAAPVDAQPRASRRRTAPPCRPWTPQDGDGRLPSRAALCKASASGYLSANVPRAGMQSPASMTGLPRRRAAGAQRAAELASGNPWKPPRAAGAQGGHQEAEVREDQREEDGHADRAAVQELPDRVHHVLPVLPQPALRRQAGLLVPAQGLPGPVCARRRAPRAPWARPPPAGAPSAELRVAARCG